jgi:multidrug efflux pump
VDDIFHWLQTAYDESLTYILRKPYIVVAAVLAVSLCTWQLARITPTAFAPQEDQGVFFTRIQGPEGASFEFMQGQLRQLEGSIQPYVDSGDVLKYLVFLPGWGSAESVNSAVSLVTMTPWEERDKSTREVMNGLMKAWQDIPGIRAFPFMRSGLQRGGGGQPVQFVIGGSSYEELSQWQAIMLEKIKENPRLIRVQTDYRETKPQYLIDVNKTRAADMGVNVQDIGRTLQAMMSEMRVTTFINEGEEYDVVVQAEDTQRASTADLTNIYVRSETTRQLIALSNLIKVEHIADAGQLKRYNRLRAVTISANLVPGYTIGEALTYLDELVKAELPATAQIDYKGESLEFKESESGLLFTFLLALLIVFLVLAAQFESFIHPIVIMIAVPLATFGALLGLLLSGETLNIYSNIGIVILIGISSKNGILIVEFINQLRDQGVEFTRAIREAAAIRLRPVMMTALSTIMGSIPLILASGAGSESRITLGVVVFSGVAVGTLMTLFVIPVFYELLAKNTGSPGEIAVQLAKLESQDPVKPATLT